MKRFIFVGVLAALVSVVYGVQQGSFRIEGAFQPGDILKVKNARSLEASGITYDTINQNLVVTNDLTVGQKLTATQIDTGSIVSSDGTLTISDQNGYGNISISPTGNISIEGNSNETLIFYDGALGLTADDSDFTMSYGEAYLYSTGSIWLDAPVIELSGSLLKSPGDPTLGSHVADRDYNDIRYGAKVGTATASTTNTVLNCSSATSWTVTLGTNTAISLTGILSGYDAAVKLTLVQDSTGSRTVTWPEGTSWSYGVEPTLSTSGDYVDIIYLTTTDGGATFYGIPAAYGIPPSATIN